MPNVLPFDKRVGIVSSLVEGNSIRATSRLLDVDKDAVMYLGTSIGLACIQIHDRLVRNVKADFLEVDEVWTFVGRHEKCKQPTDPRYFGDAYTMFAIDPESKLVTSYLTGKRSLGTATAFMKDLRKRVVGTPQISVDGWPHWPEAVRRSFGHKGCHMGVVLKEYQTNKEQQRTCSRSRVKSMSRKVVYGDPEMDFISTAIAERLNLTTRMHQRRLMRSTSGYSKKKENLRAAIGLHFMWYNFVRRHESLGTTPAVKARIVGAPWTLSQLVSKALDTAGL